MWKRIGAQNTGAVVARFYFIFSYSWHQICNTNYQLAASAPASSKLNSWDWNKTRIRSSWDHNPDRGVKISNKHFILGGNSIRYNNNNLELHWSCARAWHDSSDELPEIFLVYCWVAWPQSSLARLKRGLQSQHLPPLHPRTICKCPIFAFSDHPSLSSRNIQRRLVFTSTSTINTWGHYLEMALQSSKY